MSEIYTYTHVYLCSDACAPEPHQLVTFTDMDIKQRCQNQVPWFCPLQKGQNYLIHVSVGHQQENNENKKPLEQDRRIISLILIITFITKGTKNVNEV